MGGGPGTFGGAGKSHRGMVIEKKSSNFEYADSESLGRFKRQSSLSGGNIGGIGNSSRNSIVNLRAINTARHEESGMEHIQSARESSVSQLQ